MANDEQDQASQDAETTFEAEIRKQRDLMAAMATREKWDGESRLIVQGRKLAGGALYAAAVAAVLLILWIASSIFLNS